MTELDRLLELRTQIDKLGYNGSCIVGIQEEYEPLKSQIESKLAQADFQNKERMCSKCGKHKSSWANNRNDDVWCSKCITDVVRIEQNQELSQLRQIVQALKDWTQMLEVLDLALQGKHDYANSVLPSLYKILKDEWEQDKELKSILASSEENNYP